MDYTAAAIVLFMVMIAANMLWMARKVERIEAMLQAILEGGKFAMPKINDGMRTMELLVKAAGNLGKQIKENVGRRKLRNMDNAPIVQDVDESLVRTMARYLLAELETKSLDDVDLSETKWVRRGEWKELSGSTPEQWRAVMDRLEAAGIVERKGAKRTRVLSTAKRPSVAAKLKAYLGH